MMCWSVKDVQNDVLLPQSAVLHTKANGEELVLERNGRIS